MPSLAYRLFHIGKMPRELAEIAAQGPALLAAEGASLKFSSRGIHVPGKIASRAVSLHSGAVVLTHERLAVSVSRYTALNVRYTDPSAETAPLTFTSDEEGLHIHIDVGSAVPGGKGVLEIAVRTPIRGDVLASLPAGEQRAAMSSVEANALIRWA